MEKKNFFTSGWLFLSIAIVNLLVAVIFGPLVISKPSHLDEWFAPLCFLIPMSLALAIVGGLIPRRRAGVNRLLTALLNGVAVVLYFSALVSIISYWSR